MPVDDKPVQERNKQSPTYEACQNKVRKKSYWAMNRRYYPDGSFDVVSVRIPDVTSTDCKYDFWRTDPQCNGCQQKRAA